MWKTLVEQWRRWRNGSRATGYKSVCLTKSGYKNYKHNINTILHLVHPTKGHNRGIADVLKSKTIKDEKGKIKGLWSSG